MCHIDRILAGLNALYELGVDIENIYMGSRFCFPVQGVLGGNWEEI
jgi:hypothetical protein